MLECFKNVIDDGERLKRVQLFAHRDLPALLARVRLEFEVRTITVETDPEDDTIVVTGAEEAGNEWLLLDPDAWRDVDGTRLLWAWTLTNQQGYTDGLQMELSFGEGRSRVIQLIAMGSGLAVYHVTPMGAQ